MAQASQFQEHISVIGALRENYRRPDDAAAVASVVRSQQNAAAACSQREDEVKEAIKGARDRLPSSQPTRRRLPRSPPLGAVRPCWASPPPSLHPLPNLPQS